MQSICLHIFVFSNITWNISFIMARASKHLEQSLQFIIWSVKLSVDREWNLSADTWDTVLAK